jgi:hypothetical protein
MVTCSNCKNVFAGKVCNQCGEKIFAPEQLSIKYFLHHSIDIFTHFENKVLKSILYLITKPGLVVKENLRGVRVPYAKPVQLFIVVNLFFYLVITHFQRTDYAPSVSDARSSQMYDRPGLGWLQPLDRSIEIGIDNLVVQKRSFYDHRSLKDTNLIINNISFANSEEAKMTAEGKKQLLFISAYQQKVSFYSKTLVFVLIPVFAFCFYILFRKKLVYFGSALILATHFLSFNLLFYSLYVIIGATPEKWFGSTTYSYLPSKFINAVLYDSFLGSFSIIFFGTLKAFEAAHVIAFSIWMFISFRRLFKLHWLLNIVISYLLARVFFILIFSLYKKLLMAVTLWNM